MTTLTGRPYGKIRIGTGNVTNTASVISIVPMIRERSSLRIHWGDTYSGVFAKSNKETGATRQKSDVELDDERWALQFAGSRDVLEDLIDEITEEYNSGRTIPIG